MVRLTTLLFAFILVLIAVANVEAKSSKKKSEATKPSILDEDALKARAERHVQRNLDVNKAFKKNREIKVATDSRLRAAAKKNEVMRASREQSKNKMKKAQEAKQKLFDSAVAKKKASLSPEIQEKGQAKVDWLWEQTRRSSNGVIGLHGDAYMEYVNNGPRPYYIFLTYTALTRMHSCSICDHLHGENVALSSSHWKWQQANEHLFERTDNTTDPLLPVFYIEVDIAKNPDFLPNVCETAPMIYLIPPRYSEKKVKINQFIKKTPDKYRLNGFSFTTSADDFANHVRKFVQGHDFHVERAINYLVLILGAFALLVAAGIVYLLRNQIGKLRRQQTFAVACCWIFYLYCQAGGMYNGIRNTDFAGQDQEGNTIYVARQPRNQFGCETGIVGFLVGGCALSAIFLHTSLSPEDVQATKKKKPGFYETHILPYLNPAFCSTAMLFFWIQILNVYTLKNRGYRLGFVF